MAIPRVCTLSIEDDQAAQEDALEEKSQLHMQMKLKIAIF